ncbi:hypothetical protein B0H99_103306 [Planomicrobium soli]|uniref:Uncharacterized protein n=1 Tax=Planomicrobium soli TaxID=1176648 RepID=A0A2P8H4Q0_9BACL|nr:hypothetical protein B0H99_103306 [Planomicrobium soli]
MFCSAQRVDGVESSLKNKIWLGMRGSNIYFAGNYSHLLERWLYYGGTAKLSLFPLK